MLAALRRAGVHWTVPTIRLMDPPNRISSGGISAALAKSESVRLGLGFVTISANWPVMGGGRWSVPGVEGIAANEGCASGTTRNP
jgi:hypothetical protein